MRRSPARVIEDWWFYKGHEFRSTVRFAALVALAVPLLLVALYALVRA